MMKNFGETNCAQKTSKSKKRQAEKEETPETENPDR
jgi:hypothetical protein